MTYGVIWWDASTKSNCELGSGIWVGLLGIATAATGVYTAYRPRARYHSSYLPPLPLLTRRSAPGTSC